MHCLEWTSHVSVHANLKVPIMSVSFPNMYGDVSTQIYDRKHERTYLRRKIHYERKIDFIIRNSSIDEEFQFLWVNEL